MGTKTDHRVWPTDKRLIIFLVPANDLDEASRYAAMMNVLTLAVLRELNWSIDDIEMVGLLAPTVQHGTEGIFFLEDLGVDPRLVTLLVVWGDTAESIEFQESVPQECGVGYVALPESGAVLTTVRMPPVGEWWLDPVHREYARLSLVELIRDGRVRKGPSEEHVVFLAEPAMWN